MSFPNRPDHPDFWLMSAVMQDLDAAADDKIAIDRIIGNTVDLPSLEYMSVYRVANGLPMMKVNPLAVMGASWIDGFMAGLNFQKRKAAAEKKKEKVSENP